jgi:phospholipase/carboxylesterase
MTHVITVHTPANPPRRMVLMFHGVGARPTDLVPLGRSLAEVMADALIISVQSPQPSGVGAGWEWFSVLGITESNRVPRVAQAMPTFTATVRHWQQQAQVDAADTVLIGFSQGAIMALEATQSQPGLAGRVIALAGRFAVPPQRSPAPTSVHLFHGDADPVMPVGLAEEAFSQLTALGARVTLQRFEGLGHGIDQRVLDAVKHHVQCPSSGTSGNQ